MIRFTTKKHSKIPGWVTHTIEMPSAGWPEASYEGGPAADRLIRFAAGLVAGANSKSEVTSIALPSGWTRVSSQGPVHIMQKGMLRVTASIARGLCTLGVSCNGKEATDSQMEIVRKAFLPVETVPVEQRSLGTHTRYMYCAMPGFRLDESGSVPVAIQL